MFSILAFICATKNESFSLPWKKCGHREHYFPFLCSNELESPLRKYGNSAKLPTCFKKSLKVQYCRQHLNVYMDTQF